MHNIRLIARLDVKPPNVVKGIQLEGLRKIGNPNELANKYYTAGIDELLYIDIVASLYERNSLLGVIEEASQDVFVPITVGGGLRSVDDVNAALRSGADKVAINTAAIKDPSIITSVARRFGSQCMVLSIESKNNGAYMEAYYDNGREHSGLEVLDWAKRGEELGAGEIVLTSVDQEGTANGYDVDLIRAVTDSVSIPVIASGGMGRCEDIDNVVLNGHADALAMAHVLHYGIYTVEEIREYCLANGFPVRRIL